jgi:transcriptional regulator with XRE-family HTH domain
MKRAKSIHTKEYIELISQLRMERKRLGLSQLDVANKLKMQQSEISKIETNERRLDILEFKELLKIYNINNNKTLKT